MDQTQQTESTGTGTAPAVPFDACRARYGTFSECPLCGHGLIPEPLQVHVMRLARQLLRL